MTKEGKQLFVQIIKSFEKWVQEIVLSLYFLQSTPDNSNLREKRKRFKLSEVQVIEGKIALKIAWRENKWKFFRVSRRFELARVRVIRSRLYYMWEKFNV